MGRPPVIPAEKKLSPVTHAQLRRAGSSASDSEVSRTTGPACSCTAASPGHSPNRTDPGPVTTFNIVVPDYLAIRPYPLQQCSPHRQVPRYEALQRPLVG